MRGSLVWLLADIQQRQGVNVHQKANSTGFVLGCINQYLQERSGCRSGNLLHIAGDKQQDNQKDAPRYSANSDTGHHDLWAFNGWIWYLCQNQTCQQTTDLDGHTFNHVDNRILILSASDSTLSKMDSQMRSHRVLLEGAVVICQSSCLRIPPSRTYTKKPSNTIRPCSHQYNNSHGID